MMANNNHQVKNNKNNKQNNAVLFLIALLFSISIVGISFRNNETLKEIAFGFYSYQPPPCSLANIDSIQLSNILVSTQKRANELSQKNVILTPHQPYLVVNTTSNTFVLRTRGRIIREGLCSTGSYTQLEAGENLKWIFKTPKGMFRILNKLKDPVWVKPDWAFIEEGLPVPPRKHPDRLEHGALGDYALGIGQGYFIHGTLYQRYLGLPVTHGCIRLGDEDLAEVFSILDIGSRVYIF